SRGRGTPELHAAKRARLRQSWPSRPRRRIHCATSCHERDAPTIASRRPPVTRLLSCCLTLSACILAAAAPAAFAAQQTAETATSTPAATPPTDDTASRQLQAKLTTDEDLKEVTASVDEGVAELDGSVLQPTHKQEAGEIATETPGVATVVNNVEVDNSLGSHFRSAYRQMTGKLVAIATRGP